MKPVDLLLTTYPESGSKNVGDHLITSSAIQLIRQYFPEYNPEILFRTESLDSFLGQDVRSILAPGFSVNDKAYPTLFSLYTNEEDIRSFYPLGCSFQSVLSNDLAYSKKIYSPRYVRFLRSIVNKTGPIPCRDLRIVSLLLEWGVDAFYLGDLALYDPNKIGITGVNKSNIQSVVFTIQHKPLYAQQAFTIIDMLSKIFQLQNKYIAYQSVPNKNSSVIANYASKKGFKVIDVSGKSENLSIYDDIDLHVGYRLHGHVYFIRQRKPSVLIIEDSRSYGISSCGELRTGTFSAINGFSDDVDMGIANAIRKYISDNMKSEFVGYQKVFCKIDSDYRNIVKPYIRQLSSRIKRRSEEKV